MAPRSQPSQSDEIVVRISGQLQALQQTLTEASTLVKNATAGWDSSFTNFAAKNEQTMGRVRANLRTTGDEIQVSGQKWQKLATTASIALSSFAVGVQPTLTSVLGAVNAIAFAFGALPGAVSLAATSLINILRGVGDEAKKVAAEVRNVFRQSDAALQGTALDQRITDLDASLKRYQTRLREIAMLSSNPFYAANKEVIAEKKRLEERVKELEERLMDLRLRRADEGRNADAVSPRIGNDFRDWKRKLDAGFGKAGVEGVKDVIRAVNETAERTRKVQEEIAQGWMQAFAPMGRAIDQFVQKGGNLRDFWRMLWYDIVRTSINAMYQMVAAHTAAELAKNNITFSSVVKRVAAEAWAAIKIIAMYAAQAAAGAWAALASIPYIGPFIAIGAAMATFAGVMALAKGIGGGGSGPSGGPTGGSRSNPGTQGGTTTGPTNTGGKAANITIVAMDGQDVYRTLTRHPGAVGRAFRQVARDGGMAF